MKKIDGGRLKFVMPFFGHSAAIGFAISALLATVGTGSGASAASFAATGPPKMGSTSALLLASPPAVSPLSSIAPVAPNPNLVLTVAPLESVDASSLRPQEVAAQINALPLEYLDQSFSADDILDDKLNLLPQEFKVPAGMKKRVGFWLDIYTKYSSHFSLIHDANHPWIVYRVVDLRPIYAGAGNRFTQDANDKRAVIKARADVRALLTKLAHRKNFQNLSQEEYKLYKLLDEVQGKRKTVFAQAARNLRSQRGQKDFYRHGLIFSSRYLNEMEQIFARSDLPVELVRLPLVESSFNEEAQSKVGASGIWQFMPGTGRRYLKMSSIADERNSPIKATEAAAKLMLSNFKTTHAWPLAITSYNHGAGGVMKACRVLKSTNIADLVNKYHSRSFSFASQNFFSEFMAALYGEKYQDRIFGAMTKYPALAAETTNLQYSMRAKTLTAIVGITVEELKLYNPDLKSQAIAGSTFLPVGYHIRLPVGHKDRLEMFNQRAEEARAFVAKSSHKTNG